MLTPSLSLCSLNQERQITSQTAGTWTQTRDPIPRTVSSQSCALLRFRPPHRESCRKLSDAGDFFVCTHAHLSLHKRKLLQRVSKQCGEPSSDGPCAKQFYHWQWPSRSLHTESQRMHWATSLFLSLFASAIIYVAFLCVEFFLLPFSPSTPSHFRRRSTLASLTQPRSSELFSLTLLAIAISSW